MTGKKTLWPLVFIASALFLVGCASETRFVLTVEKEGEKREQSFSCDELKEIKTCKNAEKLLQDLRAPDLSLKGCPQAKAKTKSTIVRIKGRIKKKDIDALFYNKSTVCQDERFEKLRPLLRSIS